MQKNRIRTSDWAIMMYTGFNYVTTEKIVDRPDEINKTTKSSVQWSPILGVVLIIGGVVLIVKDEIINQINQN
jgi:hypothetical protein